MAAGLLHHVEINVSDLNRSISFWGWFLEELGYTPFQEWENGKSWKLADTYLVFVQTEERFLDVPYHRSRVGLKFNRLQKQQGVSIREQLKWINQEVG